MVTSEMMTGELHVNASQFFPNPTTEVIQSIASNFSTAELNCLQRNINVDQESKLGMKKIGINFNKVCEYFQHHEQNQMYDEVLLGYQLGQMVEQ
jgi:hypothetical protein